MKCLLCILAVALVPSPICAQEHKSSSSTQLVSLNDLTPMARRVIESGAYTGWDEKAFARAGDLGSVAIVRALPIDGPINPMQLRSVLLLVRTSFEYLDVCVKSVDDKEPRVTLLLLEHLREHGSPDTQSDIEVEDVQTFVLKQTEIAKQAR
jgi:hypothetical protein